MEKETPESQFPPEPSGPGGTRSEAERPPQPSPNWRLTPPSEKRVIKRGSDVELPRAPKREEPARRRVRGREAPTARYGYRVEITKDMTRRKGERTSTRRRMRAYFTRLVRSRERVEDRMDRAAWYIATGSGILFFILSFLPWFRVSWKLGTGEVGGGSATLRFFDLGVIGYIVPILSLFVALIAVPCILHRWPRLPFDAGSIIAMLSLICLILLLLVFVGNVGILAGAGKRSGLGTAFLSTMFITKSAQAVAYIGVVCSIAGMTSSLLRLADRQGEKKREES